MLQLATPELPRTTPRTHSRGAAFDILKQGVDRGSRVSERTSIKGLGAGIGSGMMAFWVSEITANTKPFAVRKTSNSAFFSSGEGCGRSLPSGYNDPDGHVYEDGVRIR